MQVECILQFVRLPVEDAVLDEWQDGAGAGYHHTLEEGQGVSELPEELLPFGDATGNPVTTQVRATALALASSVWKSTQGCD